MIRVPAAVAVTIALLACSASAFAQPGGATRGRADAQPRAVTPRGPLSAEERNTIGVFEAVSASVVYITTVQHVRDFFSRNVMRVPQGTGSGFVWDEQGHIVTNFHVIQGAQEALVTLGDQRSFQAQLVGSSPAHDLAVLKIDVPNDLPKPIPLGSSGDLLDGHNVLAIGNPFGLDHTLTTGIVSALNRTVDNEQGGTIENVIQTDAAINPGNSGGPLIDTAGRLVGINNMIYSPSGAYAGIGFAVPADTINRVVPLLIAHGVYVRPTLGISANDDVSRQLLADGTTKGVLVLGVSQGSPAAQAGLRPTQITRGRASIGDVIEAVDGKPVKDFAALVNMLDAHEFGDRITLTVLRGGARLQVPITLTGSR